MAGDLQDLPEALRRIVVRANRVVRLAKLRAPAAILLDCEDMLRGSVNSHAQTSGVDVEAWRAERAAKVVCDETFTEDDAAELRSMEDEMRRYEAAEPVARQRWLSKFFHPDAASQRQGAALWPELDSGYRSDLVFAVMDEERKPAASEAREAADGAASS